MCIITCVGNVKIKKFSSKKQIFCEETSFDKLRMNGLKSRFGHEKMCITDSQSERNLKNIEMHNETFITTLSSLHEAIIDFKHQNRQIAFQEYQKSRDSLIYRFKFCADLFWKFLNDQLRIQGVVVEIARPKSIFKESCDAGFISLGELQTCIEITEDRNRTSHAYHEELAEWISQRIPDYYQLMNTVAQRLIK